MLFSVDYIPVLCDDPFIISTDSLVSRRCAVVKGVDKFVSQHLSGADSMSWVL